MKSKKQQQKQKPLTLVKEHQFKRSEGNRLPTGRLATSTINIDKSIVNLTLSSSRRSDAVKLSHATKSPSMWKRMFKRKTLPEHIEENPPPVASRSIFELKTTSGDDQDSQTDSIPSKFQRLHLNTTQRLPSKSKLPPIRGTLSSSSSDQKRVSSNNPNLLSTSDTLGLRGLKNIGNTCYMNSAVQCLNSIPDIIEWAMQQRPSLPYMNIIDVYASLVHSMRSGGDSCVTPSELKDCVSRSAPIFSNYAQHDSHEFMNNLLNALQKVDSTSFFVNLFQIHTQSKVTCNNCSNVDTTDETTTFLPLPIPQLKSHDNTKVLLKDLIKDFCREDELDGQYYCQKCERCQSARHQTTIIQPLPRALIIQLKRFPFDDTNKKIDTLIQYKLEHENLLSTNDKYKLYAVSMHSGSLAGGHYTTMARNYINDRWYRFDDSYVEEIDSKSVVVPFNARQAYVLIYLKHDE